MAQKGLAGGPGHRVSWDKIQVHALANDPMQAETLRRQLEGLETLLRKIGPEILKDAANGVNNESRHMGVLGT